MTTPSIHQIQYAVAQSHGLPVRIIVDHQRGRRYAQARAEAMYIANVLTGLSFPEIGRAFGHRDHSTVIQAVDKVQEQDRRGAVPHVRELVADLQHPDVLEDERQTAVQEFESASQALQDALRQCHEALTQYEEARAKVKEIAPEVLG